MISREEPMWCADERRNAILAAPSHPLNGIDYVEYRRDSSAAAQAAGKQFRIEIQFLKPPAASLAANSAAFRIDGGVRIVEVGVRSVEVMADPSRFVVFANKEGDLSTYWIRVDDAAIDDERSEAAFSFRPGCRNDFDCRPRDDCEPADFVEPALDYLAKDYQSFRRLMMDLAPQLNPDFIDKSPADLGVTLIELFAYVGDYLSYFQDAAITEAFFDTCRDRTSAARHARLIDYAMHNGRNSNGFVQFDGGRGNGIVPAGTKLLTRILTPLKGQDAAPGTVIAAGTADLDNDPAFASCTVFETAAPVRVIQSRNLLNIHDWGDAACCLAKGSRQAWFYATRKQGADLLATMPDFEVGEYLLLEEVLGPRTGLAADADPRNRQIVRIDEVEQTSDPAFRKLLVGGELTPAGAADPKLPLLRLKWHEADSTRFSFCLSAELPETRQLIAQITIARGNVAPADHGRTVVRRWPNPTDARHELLPIETGVGRWPIDIQPLDEGPLTFQAMPEDPVYAADGRLATGRHDLDRPPQEVMPAVTVKYDWIGQSTELFRPVNTLIGSSVYDAHFVAEPGNDGLARLRFGDDQYGRRVGEPIAAEARYRIGNGRKGNLGAGALIHVVVPDAADLVDPANPNAGPVTFPTIDLLRQPLAATGGVDPQTIEQVRQVAPEAFLNQTFRAVTEQDYAGAAMLFPGVAAAKASFRWTGSWHTVVVAIHPDDPAALERLAGGGAALRPEFAEAISAWLGRFRLAGYDLIVRAANYVPVELEIQLCIAPGHFRGDVLEVAMNALSNGRLPGGATGFFHPSNFCFGEPLLASRLYALLQSLDGVESARIQVMKRYWELPNGELDRGLVPMSTQEIVRLDNDRNQPEFGVLRLTAVGGL
ncbi:MAG: hypothetical protein M3Q19_06380 [Pseudomonadota bacterium]|nr:hypothetical protein [Pseudomonadota bacterium]